MLTLIATFQLLLRTNNNVNNTKSKYCYRANPKSITKTIECGKYFYLYGANFELLHYTLQLRAF